MFIPEGVALIFVLGLVVAGLTVTSISLAEDNGLEFPQNPTFNDQDFYEEQLPNEEHNPERLDL